MELYEIDYLSYHHIQLNQFAKSKMFKKMHLDYFEYIQVMLNFINYLFKNLGPTLQ